jgi:RimJ/RimL family protein N-acetyltransferase
MNAGILSPPYTLQLRTDVQLASLSPEAADRMYGWFQDPELCLSLGLRTEPSLEKTKEWISFASSDASICARAILLDNAHVGNVVLDQIDTYLAKARFSIYVGDAAVRTQGIGSTATYLMLRIAFCDLKLNKVWLTAHARNTRALQAYARVGFQLEGLLRDECKINGERLAAWYMGILATDFYKL